MRVTLWITTVIHLDTPTKDLTPSPDLHPFTERSERKVTLHQLKIFGAVAKHLNVTKAAHEVRISQPTVSKQLRLLQDEFRVKFYLRVGQGIKLTAEGRQFWHAVQPILKGIDELRETFRRPAKETECLIVGGTQSPSSSLIPEAFGTCQ